MQISSPLIMETDQSQNFHHFLCCSLDSWPCSDPWSSSFCSCTDFFWPDAVIEMMIS
jgi:hypothetical protein